eukprot:2320126-Alexandrium_andersonii.AAC.1
MATGRASTPELSQPSSCQDGVLLTRVQLASALALRLFLLALSQQLAEAVSYTHLRAHETSAHL